MGVRTTVTGLGDVEPGPYRITESSTPLAGGDSSGAVGVITLDIPEQTKEVYTSWTEQLRNLALNPRAVAATGFSPNNATFHTVTRNFAVPVANPDGILTCARSENTGTASPYLMSMYNIDVLGQVGTPAREIGAWVRVSAAGYWAIIGTGIQVSLPAGAWTWVTGPVAAGAYSGAYVRTTSGANANPAHIAYITGVTVLSAGNVPTGFFDGAKSDTDLVRYEWLGPVNASASVMEIRSLQTVNDGSAVLLSLEKQLDFIDTSYGSTVGTIRAIERNKTSAFPWTLTAYTRLDNFNIEVQAQPYTGTLEGAFQYYCLLANITTGIVVDDALASIPVNFLGWRGNLWTNMKAMATAMNADLNLISDNVVLRPVRAFEAVTDRDIDGGVSADGTQLALKQEVIWYKTDYRTNSLIYPSGGWNPELRPLSVNSGETVETTLDASSGVNASIVSVDQPVCVAMVTPDYDTSSVYTVVGDDNIVIQPQQWLDFGGRLSVRIGDDTQSLVVSMTGASGLRQIDGSEMRTFRIALSAGTSDSTYSTLRIVGDAVHVQENSIIIPTGVDSWRTGQEFAPTVDNPFLNNLDDAYSAGVRGARRYSGKILSMSSSVSAINKRGEKGTANYPPYSFVQGEWAGQTYANFNTWAGSQTYGDIQEYFYSLVQDDFDNQAFGNAPGARYWERSVNRWFRIRNSTTEWGTMRFDADDDMTLGDMQVRFAGMTYGDVDDHFDGRTYFEANLMGAA